MNAKLSQAYLHRIARRVQRHRSLAGEEGQLGLLLALQVEGRDALEPGHVQGLSRVLPDHPEGGTGGELHSGVFAAKPETLGGEPVMLAPAAPSPERYTPAPPSPQVNVNPMPLLPNDPFASKVEAPSSNHRLDAELADVKPQTFNIDFGPGAPSGQVGPAAAGQPGDFWNTVSVNFNDQHTETDLKFAGDSPSSIEVEMVNLGGSWSSGGVMGVESPMLDTYCYPTGNKGGDSKVILRHVPAGKYHVYVYGHGRQPQYYGDYTLTAGTHNYGRKQTSPRADAIRNTKWVEGSQYVKFPTVKVARGEEMEILIQPGGQVSDSPGRNFADAMICGLQFIPVR